MPQAPISQDIFVLPQPRRVTRQPGACFVSSQSPVNIKVDDGRVVRHVATWLSQLSKNGPSTKSGEVSFVVGINAALAEQAYKLTISDGGVWLEGGAAVGCYYGLQTLKQLCVSSGGMLPCCEIEDEPDFVTRGVLHDVTRGKVPKLATLKHLVDRLSLLKINQLQLYIEHAFAFSFDPEICAEQDGLTPDDTRALDQYCRERFIDLVPAVANLGHMGRILSQPRYRNLAEIQADSDWFDMAWPQRARGLTLNVRNSESCALVNNVWTDILAAFSSPVVNICGDEPWDLGRGREPLTDEARMDLYIRHVSGVAKFCEKKGRRVQLWSDVLRNYPSSCSKLPNDVAILHWGYDDVADYEATACFVDHGYQTIVCPGTSGWKRIVNAMNLAERNIKTFARIGKQGGAQGLITTDWGDHGHFNLLACSWHGITLGASLAWHADHVTGADFDAIFSHASTDESGREFVAALRRATEIATSCETWRLLWQSTNTLTEQVLLPTEKALEVCIEASALAVMLGNKLPPMMHLDRDDLRDLDVACRVNKLAARRLLWEARRRSGLTKPDISERQAWADALMSCWPDYEVCWRGRNKETGLADIHAAITRVANEVRES